MLLLGYEAISMFGELTRRATIFGTIFGVATLFVAASWLQSLNWRDHRKDRWRRRRGEPKDDHGEVREREDTLVRRQ